MTHRPNSEEVDRVMRALPPEARIALQTMSEMQKRPAEDVLRDEIEHYVQGRIPAIDIDAAMRAVQATARQAGYWLGRLKRFAREQSEE